MKFFFFLSLLIVSSIFINCSKSKDDSIEKDDPVEDSRYYVTYKYDIKIANSVNPIIQLKIQTENGETVKQLHTSKWEATYGPFKKNDHIYINATCYAPTSSITDSYVQLYVSKEKEPFVLKGEYRTLSKTTFSAEYTIDF